MSSYLELCQAVRRDCRVAGTGPTSVTGQTGLLGDLVAWVAQAYTEIQNRHASNPPRWRWLRHEFELDTAINDDTYASGDCTDKSSGSAISRFSTWLLDDEVDRPRIKQASYQIVDIGGDKTTASSTGLSNDATAYTASISVGGTANAISVTGSAAQTIADLVTEINTDLSGADIELSAGNLRVVADDTDDTVAITDTDLFSSLTGFDEIETAVESGGETWMIFVPWDWFKTIYRIGTQNAAMPIHITVDPQNNLVVGPKPDKVYRITGDFFRSAQVLSADSDTPEMPSQFHDLIVYRTMEKYGWSEAAEEILSRGRTEGAKLMRQLEMNQLPRMEIMGPLV